MNAGEGTLAPATASVASTRVVRLQASEIAQVLTISGALAYAAAWLFFSAVYSRFGLAPEQVGIDLNYLFVRASFLAGVVTVLFAGGIAFARVGGVIARARRGDLLVFNIAFAFWNLVFGAYMAAITFLSLKYFAPRISWPITVVLAIVSAALVVFVVGAVLLRGLRFRAATQEGPRLGDQPNFLYLGAAIMMILVSFVPGIAAAGIATGDHIKDGSPIDSWFVHAPRVEVISDASDSPTSSPLQARSPCIIQLGSNNGDLTLWNSEAHTLMQLPRGSYKAVVILPNVPCPPPPQRGKPPDQSK